VIAQVAGGIAGAVLANAMFDLAPILWCTVAPCTRARRGRRAR
jgi:hypothetical protein